MSEVETKSEKMSSESDKTENHCFGHNLSEVERHFKRLKVDESDIKSDNKPKGDYPLNYFSSKSTPYSPKISFSDKRQSLHGFRRQRLHISNKIRTTSENSPKIRSNELESVSEDKELGFHTDFSELRLNSELKSGPEVSEDNRKSLYFNKDFKLESNEWRKSVKEYHKLCKKSEQISTNSEPKNNKIKKLQFKDDKSCARQAMDASCDASVDELAAYLDDTLFLPRKMSFMAEMMYT